VIYYLQSKVRSGEGADNYMFLVVSDSPDQPLSWLVVSQSVEGFEVLCYHFSSSHDIHIDFEDRIKVKQTKIVNEHIAFITGTKV
jgi:hypothetical protein